MKNTILLQILKYWNELSYKEKIDLLQKYEIENSNIQNRKARELVVDEDMNSDVGGLFSYEAPSFISIPKPTLFDGLHMASSVTHEGYHAYIYDHMKDKCDLNLYSDIDINEFYKEKKYDRKLMNICNIYQDGAALFALYSIEEGLAEKESALHIMYNLLKSCDNKIELLNIADLLNNVIDLQTDRELAKKTYSKSKYDAIKSFCESAIINDIDHYNLTKKINKNLNPKLVENFDENLRLFVMASQYPESFDKLKIGMKVGQNLLNLYDDLELGKE